MRNFLTGTLQSIGILIAIAGCIFQGTPKGDAKAMLFGISGLSLYLIVTFISGRTYIYNKFAGGRELSRDESPGEFFLLIVVLILVIGFMIFRCIHYATAA
jgi:hypothetical protein